MTEKNNIIEKKNNIRELFKKPGIYPVITTGFTKGRSPIFVLQELVSAGADIVQLRMKNESPREILQIADLFREICSKNRIVLIINDRPDIAIASSADGVHLGQDDIPHCRVANFAKGLFIGVSTHSLDEAIEAENKGADYINIGPIYPTNTKTTKTCPLGINTLREIAKTIKIPFTVMGGIKAPQIPELLGAGARRIAMVTEICEAENISEKFSELNELIQKYSK